ncbi:MAG: phosphosulfolactate synthase [Candidatus Obscuribacterales bacterium]
MSEEYDNPFAFLKTNFRGPKPRGCGLTEIRGPYYTPVGCYYLQDVLSNAAPYIDSFKFAGGSFTLLPRATLEDLIDICHENEVTVSTGGFIEYVLTQGRQAVSSYLDACKQLGFDTVELSCGFISLGTEDWMRLVDDVWKRGMRAKPELGIQFGAGGDTSVSELEAEGVRDVKRIISQGRRFVDMGVELLMIESEGITENVRSWRTDVITELIDAFGVERLMFEAADPEVFAWYVKNFGPEVNLFVDHSQIVQLEAIRRGIWGPSSLWGRVQSYRDESSQVILATRPV